MNYIQAVLLPRICVQNVLVVYDFAAEFTIFAATFIVPYGFAAGFIDS